MRFAGYETLEAADGESGLDMATRREFDLLLLDLVLPKRDEAKPRTIPVKAS